MPVKKLYRFYKDVGRHGEIEGLFIATDEKVANTIGKTVYFGEILGKHSEVIVDLEVSHFSVITADQCVIQILQDKLGESCIGYNPLDFLDE